jgi:hypothetical protein
MPHTDPNRRREYYAAYRRSRRGKSRELRAKHGITIEDYEIMLARQDGGCAICGGQNQFTREKYLHVDHDHITGQIRGLLCAFCNQSIGRFKDDVQLLKNAIVYLEKHKGEAK